MEKYTHVHINFSEPINLFHMALLRLATEISNSDFFWEFNWLDVY